jgi:hypothetical protein
MTFILVVSQNSENVLICPHEETKYHTLLYIQIRTITKCIFFPKQRLRKVGSKYSHTSFVGQIVWAFVLMLFLNEMLAILLQDAGILDFVNNVSSPKVQQFLTEASKIRTLL